jgi:uncharacterized protein YkwD
MKNKTFLIIIALVSIIVFFVATVNVLKKNLPQEEDQDETKSSIVKTKEFFHSCWEQKEESDINRYGCELAELTNQERHNEELDRLKYSQCLENIAYRKVMDMRSREYFDHEDAQGNHIYEDIFDECSQIGNSIVVAGENLSVSYETPRQAHLALMDSPTHKDNILKEEYTHIGIWCDDVIKMCAQMFSGTRNR